MTTKIAVPARREHRAEERKLLAENIFLFVRTFAVTKTEVMDILLLLRKTGDKLIQLGEEVMAADANTDSATQQTQLEKQTRLKLSYQQLQDVLYLLTTTFGSLCEPERVFFLPQSDNDFETSVNPLLRQRQLITECSQYLREQWANGTDSSPPFTLYFSQAFRCNSFLLFIVPARE